MKNRSKAYNRDQSYRKAIKRKKLSTAINYYNEEYYDNLHQYSKNKIHCSCGMCSRYSKTNNKIEHRRRIKGNYAPSYNPPIRDRKKLYEEEET